MMSKFKHSPPLFRIERRQRLLSVGLLLTVCASFLGNPGWAQNGENAAPVEIESEVGELDVPTGAYVLRENVKIIRGNLTVLADEGRAFAAESGGFERVELSGAPTRWNDTLEDGSRVDGESDEILYDFTTNLITMRGNAEIRNIQGEFSGNQLVYNLDTQRLVGDGGVRLLIEPATAQSASEQVLSNDEGGETDADSSASNEEPESPPELPQDDGSNSNARGD